MARLAVRLAGGSERQAEVQRRKAGAQRRPAEGHGAGAEAQGAGAAEGQDAGAAQSHAFDWATSRAHCRAAWLRGRFLATGSLSLGPRAAHLEFVVPIVEGPVLAEHLADAGLQANQRLRRGRAVLTWKRTETILAFLRLCGASASILEVESQLVMRQLQGHLNRVLNAETANLERSVASSARQLAIIEQLEAGGRLAELPDIDRAVAGERSAAPEASFTELASRLGLSRARVQRAFQRLETAATATLPSSDL